MLTLWPFGPQVFFCNVPIKTLDDLKGLKVRTSSASMAQLVQKLGATAVTLPFSEVYPALQRGVANCAVTSPTAGNSAKWPEITNHFLPLSLSAGVQGHFVSLAYWNRFSPESQQKLVAAFKKMEDDMWDLAIKANDDATNCNIGKDPCVEGTKFNMTLVTVSPNDTAKVRDAVSTVILPAWRDMCNAVNPNCSKIWNDTVGKVTGYEIK
jgi:TRAP-type C4-dicarboxylate transport system substrate-binding protein